MRDSVFVLFKELQQIRRSIEVALLLRCQCGESDAKRVACDRFPVVCAR